MTRIRKGHSCLVYNKYLYQIAGLNLDSVEKIYIDDIRNMQKYQWIEISDKLSTQKYASRSVIYDGKIFVIGGVYVGPSYSTKIDIIDPSTDTITSPISLRWSTSYTALTVVYDRIYMFGGYDSNGRQAYIQYYDEFTRSPTVPTTARPTRAPTNKPTRRSYSNPSTEDDDDNSITVGVIIGAIIFVLLFAIGMWCISSKTYYRGGGGGGGGGEAVNNRSGTEMVPTTTPTSTGPRRMMCGACGGAGRKHCIPCGGQGGSRKTRYVYKGTESYWDKCYHCSGSGRSFCYLCSGMGYNNY
eukprot:287101_1